MFSSSLKIDLSAYNLLNHPFYQRWNKGELPIEILQSYAQEYYHNVEAFPRYVSSVHSNCMDIKNRKVLLDNLIDEESGDEDHPELWVRFGESLGLKREDIKRSLPSNATKALVDGFLAEAKSSYAEGLGALFAYESQVPEVAKSKIDGLKKFYNYRDDNKGLKFFKVHISADAWHSQECADLLDQLDTAEQELSKIAALKVAKLLWSFLDQFEQLQ